MFPAKNPSFRHFWLGMWAFLSKIDSGMFVRIKTLHANQRTYQYVHSVENRWDQGKVRQRLVASLGRWDQLQASGNLRRVIEGLVEQLPAGEAAGGAARGPPAGGKRSAVGSG